MTPLMTWLLVTFSYRCEGMVRRECETFPFFRSFYGAESLVSPLPTPDLPGGAQSCRACLAAAIYVCWPRFICQSLSYQNSLVEKAPLKNSVMPIPGGIFIWNSCLLLLPLHFGLFFFFLHHDSPFIYSLINTYGTLPVHQTLCWVMRIEN